MEEDSCCKAIVQQGTRKKQQCQRSPKMNGYCIYHQRNAEYDKAIYEGKILCGMFFRGCDLELSKEDIKQSYKNCEVCRKKKNKKEFKCQKDGCTYSIEKEEDKYCKKHIRLLLYDDEKEHNIQYCDIARGCFEKVINGNKCESCKNKEKNNTAAHILKLRELYHIDNNISDMTELHKVQEVYTISVAELWRSIQRNAYSRCLLFTISEFEFEKLTIQPCYYCGFQSISRLNGIDRVDNNKGYILSNCITCCKMCNTIKNTQHPLEFLDKVQLIYSYSLQNLEFSLKNIEKWTSYISSTPRDSYNHYKFEAKRRNINLTLTDIEYNRLICGKCYLCGIPNITNVHMNGVDRLDSSIRCYSLDNSKTCCGHCNVMKGILSYSDFIKKIVQINNYKCNISIFIDIPIYNNTKCRNEFYSAEEIYKMMINGKYMNYIEWCNEHNKTPEFTSAINEIRHKNDLLLQPQIMIENIKIELDRERSRNIITNTLNTKKNMSSVTLYCYLTQGKKDDFINWFQQQHDKTSLFDDQLEQLIELLPSITREKGIELCKKFLYDEKNRRNVQIRRKQEQKVIKYSNLDTIPINEIIYPSTMNISFPISSPIVDKVIDIQENKGYSKVSLPKQWKTKQIYEFIQGNNEQEYKKYCEEHNTIPQNWDEIWNTFIISVKGKTYVDSEAIVKGFVENLRRIRHNALCAKDTVEREDREIWPATTVVKAFLDNKLDKFKQYTESHVGENTEDPKWIKRWNQFVISLEQNRHNEVTLKDICTKFMMAQRIKKYRSSKK